MVLKIKAFIYRFSNIFNANVYLAKKEERKYLHTLGKINNFEKNIHSGLWQAEHGFTTVWTYKMPKHKAFIAKVKHAFDFRYFK